MDERGRNGTSLISLIIPPGEQIAKTQKKLLDELGKASSIQSDSNRQSVEEAIKSTRERLKLYSKAPKNGLVVYCGNVYSEDGRSKKKLTIDFEPFKPVNHSLYYCGEQFNVGPLKDLVEDDERFGFIVVDGDGALFAALQGSAKNVLLTVKTKLPNKQKHGGQSALRYSRNREIARHDYLRRVAEAAKKIFITDDKVNVAGLILAGSADLKTRLAESEMLDQRLAKKVIKIVDVSYGFGAGLNEAIRLAAGTLGTLKYIQEQKLISRFFQEVNVDSAKIVFGVEDTMHMAEMSLVKTLVVWEGCDYTRLLVRTSRPNEAETVVYLKGSASALHAATYKDAKSGIEGEVQESASLSDWLLENHKRLGMELQFVSDKSQEGFQFVKGFGGCAGFLKYAVPVLETNFNGKDESEFDLEADFM